MGAPGAVSYSIEFVPIGTSVEVQLQGSGGVYFVDAVTVTEAPEEASEYQSAIAQVVQTNDYSPFGAPLAGRTYKPIDENGKIELVKVTFDSGTDGWVSNGATLGNSQGRLQLLTYNAAAQSAQKTYTNLLTIGKKYRVSFDFIIDGITIASFTLSNGSTQVRDKLTTITTKEITEFTATATNLTLLATLSAGNYGRLAHIDNLVIEEIFEVGEGYRFGFNGMEKDDEVKGSGNSVSYEARIYDTRLGRWVSIDALANKYPAISPFVFALNTPIMAKDPDGNVVIFINGQHAGSGGTAIYWGGYDGRVMDAIGDHSARYVDGALGGWKNTSTKAGVGAFAGSRGGWIGSLAGAAFKVFNSSNVNMKVRIAAGAAQGMKDAADIIANLKEGETIKIVTHSMGTGFARGYTEGILKYAKAHGLTDKVKFEYELDVNSFQGGDLPADKNVKQTQNKTGGLDGGNSIKEALNGNSVPTVDKVPGAVDLSKNNPDDAQRGHAIDKMDVKGVPYLGNHGGRSAKPIEQGSNNEKKP